VNCGNLLDSAANSVEFWFSIGEMSNNPQYTCLRRYLRVYNRFVVAYVEVRFDPRIFEALQDLAG